MRKWKQSQIWRWRPTPRRIYSTHQFITPLKITQSSNCSGNETTGHIWYANGHGWAWDGTAGPNDFCPWDLSPKDRNPGTVPTIFVPVRRVPRESVPSPGICVPGQKYHGIPVPLPMPANCCYNLDKSDLTHQIGTAIFCCRWWNFKTWKMNLAVYR